MRKSEELIEGCIARALPEEMCFTLLSRDPIAPYVIRTWCVMRVARGLNKSNDPKILEARACAEQMLKERDEIRTKLGKPVEVKPKRARKHFMTDACLSNNHHLCDNPLCCCIHHEQSNLDSTQKRRA